MEDNNIKSYHTFTIVDWREYLDPNTSLRVEKFLKYNGTRVFTNLIDSIEKSIHGNTKKVVVLVHPNVSSLIILEEDNYIEILDHCLFYFKSIEDYLICARIKKLKEFQIELCNINLNLENGKQHQKSCTKGES